MELLKASAQGLETTQASSAVLRCAMMCTPPAGQHMRARLPLQSKKLYGYASREPILRLEA